MIELFLIYAIAFATGWLVNDCFHLRAEYKEAERETLEAKERWRQVKATRKALPPAESEDIP